MGLLTLLSFCEWAGVTCDEEEELSELSYPRSESNYTSDAANSGAHHPMKGGSQMQRRARGIAIV